MLVDHLGRPIHYQPSGAGLYEAPADTTARLRRPQLDRDFGLMLSRDRFRHMISDARWIHGTFPIVSGASRQKAQYVSANGWRPVFLGEDADYERAAADPISRVLKRATNRGWSFSRAWRLVCRALDYDGGIFMLHHRHPQTGWPITQFIEAHRVGQRHHASTATGAYDGARMVNGIIYSDDGDEIAYNVLGPDPSTDRQIPVGQMYHLADYTYFSENRPFPAVAYAILDWYDIKETRGFQKISNKVNSALSVVEENETGASINNPIPGTVPLSDPSGLKVETYEAGMIRYIRSGRGKITAHSHTNPSSEAQEFDRKLEAGALYGMGWRAEMVDISRLTGAGVRGFADNINQVIRERHELLSGYALLDFQWRLACLADLGELPEHPEWHRWAMRKPARFDVDRGRTSALELEEVRAGRKSMSHLIDLDGEDEDDVLERQAHYIAKRNAMAAKHGIDPAELGTLAKPGDLPRSASSPSSSDPLED